jgi:hypothetical protein
MSRFQKIAIGLLGFTNPEMFIPMSRPTQASSAKVEFCSGQSATESFRLRGAGARVMGALRFIVAAVVREG